MGNHNLKNLPSSLCISVRILISVYVLLSLIWMPPHQEVAWGDSAYDPIIAHLEYLGYQCDMVEQGVRARHSSKLHIVLSYQKGGILLQTAFPGKGSEQDASKCHALANGVNLRTQVSRAAWNAEGHLFVTAWMPGLYDKTRFALFMEAWERDSQVLRDMATDLKPYLKE